MIITRRDFTAALALTGAAAAIGLSPLRLIDSAFAQNASAADGLVAVIALVCVAPFLRYLAGTLLADTGGSVLAVALLHASFNASGHLTAAAGGWQFIPALLILTLLVVTGRRWAGRTNRRQTSPSRPG